jgi:hypothetical protein
MKVLNYLPLIFSLLICSCTKPGVVEKTALPGVAFQILNKKGEAMVTSHTDTVIISYTSGGSTQVFREPVIGLNLPATYPEEIEKYHSVMASDQYSMTELSVRAQNPVHTFNLSLNGKTLGTIYFDYNAYMNALNQASSPAFTFNGVPITADVTGGMHLNIIQL